MFLHEFPYFPAHRKSLRQPGIGTADSEGQSQFAALLIYFLLNCKKVCHTSLRGSIESSHSSAGGRRVVDYSTEFWNLVAESEVNSNFFFRTYYSKLSDIIKETVVEGERLTLNHNP